MAATIAGVSGKRSPAVTGATGLEAETGRAVTAAAIGLVEATKITPEATAAVGLAAGTKIIPAGTGAAGLAVATKVTGATGLPRVTKTIPADMAATGLVVKASTPAATAAAGLEAGTVTHLAAPAATGLADARISTPLAAPAATGRGHVASRVASAVTTGPINQLPRTNHTGPRLHVPRKTRLSNI